MVPLTHVQRMPFVSAFGLVAVQARLQQWSRADLRRILPLRPRAAEWFGWSDLPRATRRELRLAFGLRHGQMSLGADLWRWFPKGLRSAVRHCDPTRWERLRFCAHCLREGHHSPLFQLPWWFGCPVHQEPLRESCSHCDAPLRAGLGGPEPARMLNCPQCNCELADMASVVGLASDEARTRARGIWLEVVGAYLRWTLTVDAMFVAPLEVRTSDTILDSQVHAVLAQAVAVANASMALPPLLRAHLLKEPDGHWGHVWLRRVADATRGRTVPSAVLAPPSGPISRRPAERSMPLTEPAYLALHRAFRRVRRQLRVRELGNRCPGLAVPPDERWFDWSGKGSHPVEIAAFRLLTGLVSVSRLDDVPYLAFSDASFLDQPPCRLARAVLRGGAPPSRVGYGSLEADLRQWAYERLLLEAWWDVCHECLHCIGTSGFVGLRDAYGEFPCYTSIRRVRQPVTATSAPSAALLRAHPRLDAALGLRSHVSRCWAAILVRTREGAAAIVGRGAPLPFAEPRDQWPSRWTLPGVMEQFAGMIDQRTDPPAPRTSSSRIGPRPGGSAGH